MKLDSPLKLKRGWPVAQFSITEVGLRVKVHGNAWANFACPFARCEYVGRGSLLKAHIAEHLKEEGCMT